MNRKTFLKSLVSFSLCLALVAPSLVGVALAQPGGDNAKLLVRLQNRQKLVTEGKKFETAVAKLKPLASKSAFTEQDLATVDAFINETDGGEQIAVRAQSKAFAAAQGVKSFEDGVKNAAKGKSAKEFIDSLEDNPKLVNQIPGANEAAKAFTNSVKADAEVLKTVGEKLKAQGKKPISQNLFSQPVQFGFINASFMETEKTSCQTEKETFSNISFNYREKDAMVKAQSGVLEAALIALAAAYLGVQLQRLTSGAIGRCIDRALAEHRRCRARERADGNGLSTSEKLFCRGEFLFDAYICIILPI